MENTGFLKGIAQKDRSKRHQAKAACMISESLGLKTVITTEMVLVIVDYLKDSIKL